MMSCGSHKDAHTSEGNMQTEIRYVQVHIVTPVWKMSAILKIQNRKYTKLFFSEGLTGTQQALTKAYLFFFNAVSLEH